MAHTTATNGTERRAKSPQKPRRRSAAAVPFTRPRSLAGLGREGRIVAQSVSPNSPVDCLRLPMVLTVTVLSRANTDVVEVAPEKARGQVPVVDANVRESDTVCVGLRRTSGRRPAIAPTTLPIGS